MRNFTKDSKGFISSVELLLGLVILIVIIGITTNIIENSNEKISNSVKNSYLERITEETADYLIKNPGTPENWQYLNNFNNIIPGFAIIDKNKDVIPNTVMFEKIKLLENNYDNLIAKNFFKNEIKSSIAIYPINSRLNPIIYGDNDLNSKDIVVANRTIKSDFLSNLVVTSISKKDENIDYQELCNHAFSNRSDNLNHSTEGENLWICKNFRVYKKNLEYNDYFLIFDDNTQNSGFWILDSGNHLSNNENSIFSEKVNLNSYFDENLKNNNVLTFYLHCKIKQSEKNHFNCVLVAIPKGLDINSLNIEYFKVQECYFILKTAYK